MPYQRDTAADPHPRTPQGGLIVAVKSGVIAALRRALTGTSLSDETNKVHIDMEYPMVIEHYPGIWVQFSFTSLEPSGMGHVTQDEDGNLIQQWMFQGRVSLSLVALTSLERDKLADEIIMMFAFSTVPSQRVLDSSGVFRDEPGVLYEAIRDNPHMNVTINTDTFRPMGQSVTVGVPWDPDRLAYEDGYSFEMIGEFQSVTDKQGAVRLSRIDVIPEFAEDQTGTSGKWY